MKKNKITSVKINSSENEIKEINLDNISWKTRILAGLVSIDNLLMQVRVSIRVESNYVTFKCYWSKDATLVTFKLRVSTFKRLYNLLTKAHQKISKEIDYQR